MVQRQHAAVVVITEAVGKALEAGGIEADPKLAGAGKLTAGMASDSSTIRHGSSRVTLLSLNTFFSFGPMAPVYTVARLRPGPYGAWCCFLAAPRL